MRNETHRRFVLAGGAIVLVLGVVATYLYARTIWLNETAKKELKARETELSTRMIKEKAKIYQDLDEKYRADQVSYQAMSERMEIEKERVKKLEEQLKTKKPKN